MLWESFAVVSRSHCSGLLGVSGVSGVSGVNCCNSCCHSLFLALQHYNDMQWALLDFSYSDHLICSAWPLPDGQMSRHNVQVTSRWGLSQSLLATISESNRSATPHGCHHQLPGRHHKVRCPCANGQHPGTQRALGQPPAPQTQPDPLVCWSSCCTDQRKRHEKGTEQVSLLANGVPSECLDAQIRDVGF